MTELTYQLNRGYWHWTCLRCGARGREHIPDQAYQEVETRQGQWLAEVSTRVETARGRQEMTLLVPVIRGVVRVVVEGYTHNPGNPALVVCPACNGSGKPDSVSKGHPFRFLLNIPLPPASSGDGAEPGPPASGYELLEQPWLSYSRIARHFAGGASPQDREDLEIGRAHV
jgi:hypothetical protein